MQQCCAALPVGVRRIDDRGLSWGISRYRTTDGSQGKLTDAILLTSGASMQRREFISLLGAAAATAPLGGHRKTHAAEAFPTRAITIVVPYTPGGPIDSVARLIAQESDLSQSIVVDNRPGASGIIGTNAVARAEPDGHMLVLGSNQTHATNQSLIRNCPYDAVRDFSPVAGIAAMPHVLLVRKDFTATDVAGLVAIAQAKPGSLTYGSPGNGSGAHLATELFKTKAGIDILHVPFKGLAPMTTELLAGRIDMSIAPLPGLIAQQIEAGNLRALGIASARRDAQLPSIPTIAEAGIAGVEADAWTALFAPARTPPAIIARLYRAVEVALAKNWVRTNLARQGIPVALTTPAEVAAMLPAEVEKWAGVIKAAHITPE
jgi:tripartite-type tricarboxylate transporter receptor subunit TctC